MIDVPVNIDWLQYQAGKNPEKLALIENDMQLTYYNLNKQASKAAGYLKESGVKSGTRAGLIGTNSSKFVTAVFGLWKLGAVPVVLNSRLSISEIKKQLAHSESRFLLADFSLFKDYDSLQNIVTVINIPSTLPEYDNIVEINGLWRDEALILYTSGSSGESKGVIITFDNLYYNAEAVKEALGNFGEGSWLASLPFYHIGGFAIITRSILLFQHLIISDSLKPGDLNAAMNKFKPSYLSMVPTMLKRMLDKGIQPYEELSNLFLGGGPSDDKLVIRALKEGWPVNKVYGSSETCSMVTLLPFENAMDKPSSSGIPLKNNRIVILNEEGVELPDNVEGEIAVSGKTIMKGYLNSRELTESKFRHGFYLTGDRGFLDKEGFLFVSGRKDDIIISGGENIDPHEIEGEILEYDAVQDACVISMPDEEWGEAAVAVVVLKKDNGITADELNGYLRKSLAAHKIPKKYYIVEKIPRTELGKVDKTKLLNMLNSC